MEAEGNIVAGKSVITKATYIDTVRCVTPRALFTYSPLVPYYDTATFSTSISFGNLSASADSVLCDFGDGSTTNVVNPSHVFNCPGLQNVKLIAVNKICSPYQIDTMLFPIYITDTTNYFQKLVLLPFAVGIA
ncbi:MAG: PKD repeat protein [Saprospiraceae bacterium]